MRTEYMFVYGSLMKGFDGHDEISVTEHMEYVRDETVDGLLYDLGDYPGFVRIDKSGKFESYEISGELYKIPDESILSQIDEFECFDEMDHDNSLYIRRSISTKNTDTESWIYEYNNQKELNPNKIIRSGSWRKYMNVSK